MLRLGQNGDMCPGGAGVGKTCPGGTRGGDILPSGAGVSGNSPDSVTQERTGPRHGQERTQRQAQAGPVR